MKTLKMPILKHIQFLTFFLLMSCSIWKNQDTYDEEFDDVDFETLLDDVEPNRKKK